MNNLFTLHIVLIQIRLIILNLCLLHIRVLAHHGTQIQLNFRLPLGEDINHSVIMDLMDHNLH